KKESSQNPLRPGEQYVLFQPGEEKKEPAGKGAPVTITAFGNKLIVTSDDPQALALVQELVRLMMATNASEGDWEFIRLKKGNAVDVARILDEAFNGPAKQGGASPKGGGGLPFPFPGGGGPGGLISAMMGGGGGGAAGGREEKIRVVADPSTNSLLVRARP